MGIIRLRIAQLFEFNGRSATHDHSAISRLVQEQFGFLRQPLIVTIEGDEVVLQIPEVSSAAQTEAARLAKKAAKRAAEGNYAKAIDIFKRVLELHPSLHSARRDLAMAYVEVGDVDNALNHLIQVLRFDPKDAWSWVVLGNLYIRDKSDRETGEKFLRKALEIKPDDAWALNSLAAVYHDAGRAEEAVALFEQAIAANPDFPNPYYGEAVAFESTQETQKALGALRRLFSRGKMQDARSQPVFDNARKLFAKLQADLAEQNRAEALRSVESYKEEMETLSAHSIRTEEEDFEDRVGARIQMAWKHGRDYHLISTRRGYAPELLCHLEAHELTHLKLESEARKVGKNLFFATTAHTRETAIRSVAGDLRRWQKEGHSEELITNVTQSMISGLCGFLFNCPLDMLIERHISTTFPVLHPFQYLSARIMAMEAWKTNSNPEVLRMTPRAIMRATLALNGAYCLFLDNLFQDASAFALSYSKLHTSTLSQRLYKHWQERSQNLRPGDEYKLVDEFAEILGLRDWYVWKPDPGNHDVAAPPPRSGTTSPELLQQEHPAAIWHLLSALKRYDKLSVDKVREISFEIGLLGQQGLDYADPEPKYTLRSLPGEQLSGLQLMCLMFVGFKRIAPEIDTRMELHEPFLVALDLFQQKPQNS